MTIPAVENLQPIANKLIEASQKIYEAVELAAQLGIKPRQLSNICSINEHIENVQVDLLEAAKRPFPAIPMTGGAIGMAMSGRRLGDIPYQEMDRLRAELSEQLRLKENVIQPLD